MLFVFVLAGLAVDVSRYYLQSEQAQNIADGAALAGARALGQYDFDVDEGKVHSQVLNYIQANYGPRHARLYGTDASGKLENVHVARFPADTSARRCQSFSIHNGTMQMTQPAPVQTEVLGTALQVGDDPLPITARIRISDPSNPNVYSDTDPWGSFDDPVGGDMNDGRGNRDVDLSEVDEDMELDVIARSWDSNHHEKMTVSTGDDNAFTFKDGDNIFRQPGYRGQGSTDEFVEDYVNDDGEIDIQSNQAIVFFELYAQPDDDVPWNDKQDLVVLLTFGSSSASGGRFGGGLPAWMTRNGTPCGNSMPVYRVGVPVYDSFEPLFLPESVFGSNEEKARGIVKTAVAEVRPRILNRYGKTSVNCATYAGGPIRVNAAGIRVTGNGRNGGSLCSNDNVTVNSSSPGIDRVVMAKNASLNGPGSGGVANVSRFSGNRGIPELDSAFTRSASRYTVDMTQGAYVTHFAEADYNGGCNADSRSSFRRGRGPNDDRQMMAGRDPVVWQGSNDPVCVQKTGNTLKITGNGRIVSTNDPGRSLTIFTNRNVRLDGQIQLNGGLFSTRSITVNGAGYSITGDPGNVGGLALWAGNNLTINMNMSAAGAALTGIVGARGDVTFGPTSDHAPALQGVLIAGGQLTLRGRNQMNLIHDQSTYDASVLDASDWTRRTRQTMGATVPPMAEATVRLVQ